MFFILTKVRLYKFGTWNVEARMARSAEELSCRYEEVDKRRLHGQQAAVALETCSACSRRHSFPVPNGARVNLEV